MSTIPIYKKVYMELKQNIKDGIYPPGSYLPTESELEEQFNISRTTVRKAVKLLTADGTVTVQQGRGTEVQDVSISQKLNKVSSFTETLKQKGYAVTTQGMSIEIVPAPAHAAKQLKIAEGTPVYFVQRVQCADQHPIGIMENYLVLNLFPDLEKYTGTFLSLYDFLETHYRLSITDAYERISAAGANFVESQILQVPMGTPLLISRRVTYTGDTPFECCSIKSIADKYEYEIYLQGRK